MCEWSSRGGEAHVRPRVPGCLRYGRHVTETQAHFCCVEAKCVGSGTRNLISFDKSSFQMMTSVISDMDSELEWVGQFV